MGQGASSSNTTSIITRNAVDAMVQNIMNCRSNAAVSQKFVLSGSYNTISNFKMTQYFKLSADCAQDTKSVSDLQQSVSNALKSTAESQSVSLLGVLGSSSAEVNTTIENDVRASITQKTILDIINNSNAEQVAVISGNNNIIDNFSMAQTTEIVAKNCQAVLAEMSTVQKMASAVESGSSAKQSNFLSDILNSIFQGLSSIGLIWMIVIVVGIIVVGIVIIKGGPIMAFFRGDDKKGGGIFDSYAGTA